MRAPNPLASLRDRWPPTRQLWTIVGAIALFTTVAAVANVFAPRDRAVHADALGQDFMAFYSAGRLAAAGDGPALYDLTALGRLQHAIADRSGYAMAADVAPWWNPPHAALPLAVLAAGLDFRAALIAWTSLGIACLLAAAFLLSEIVGEASLMRRHRWLAIAAVVAAPPTLQALAHGQNTPLSLLLLSLAVVAWRARRPIAAGIACAMLAYKPQLAAIVMLGCLATLGWRVLVGAMIGIVPPLLATLSLLPGAIAAFVARVPASLHRIQFESPYLWHRHATIVAFLRHALQGNAPGETAGWIAATAAVVTLAVLVALAFAWRRTRVHDAASLDRFIAATILATPLLVPFFFDYDLLLLVIAAVLIGREMLAVADDSRAAVWLRRVGAIAFAWTLVNPPLAESTGANLTVPLLCIAFGLQVRRCTRQVASPIAVAEDNRESCAETNFLRIAA